MKIRVKLTVLPIIAMLLPLLGGTIFVRHAARTFYAKQIGILYLTIAKDMVDALDRDVIGQVRNLNGWIKLFNIARQLETVDTPPLDPDAVQNIEAKWPSLKQTDEPLRSILHNPLAEQLVRCKMINPLFVELMLTDREGRLIAATNPTTDYWQADEAWWKNAAEAGGSESGWAHGIMYDASAGVQTMDIVLPIRNEAGELVGVVKGSLDAIKVLRQLEPDPWNAEISRDILFHDGRLFARLNQNTDGGPLPERVSAEAFSQLVTDSDDWKTVELFPGKPSLAVCVPVGMKSGTLPAPVAEHTIYVMVHRGYASAMAPVTKVIQELTLQGLLLVAIIAILSFVLSTVWFARPLGKLRRAALHIADHVQRQEQGRGEEVHRSIREVEQSLQQLDSIRTRDEMQELAGVFVHMGGRVLNFHRELERELTRKTEEINQDLVMAREFQEALLPDNYPQIPSPPDSDTFNLFFSHIYRPAQSVSGDFFDISEISKHCVRVVVADVMGHGARSALMTAMLHALIYDTAKEDVSPAHLLQRMNEEFHALGERAGQTVFVTAAHLIIDTRRRVVRYAVAGHPSPLIIDRAAGTVVPLISEDERTAAAGLFPDSIYTGAEYTIDKPHSILLYTDGVTEAENPQNEEFGVERLAQAVREGAIMESPRSLPEYLLETIESFMDTTLAMDDICLVSIDIARVAKK